MSNIEQSFIYKDARGNITARDVINPTVSTEYIQGICIKSNAIRTFRKDRILEIIKNKENTQKILSHFREINPPPTTRVQSGFRQSNVDQQPEICFTGFASNDKQKLTKLAKSNGMYVCKSVTVNLNYLCCGKNAGPTKMEKSRQKGVLILSEHQFTTMLETGEVPEEG